MEESLPHSPSVSSHQPQAGFAQRKALLTDCVIRVGAVEGVSRRSKVWGGERREVGVEQGGREGGRKEAGWGWKGVEAGKTRLPPTPHVAKGLTQMAASSGVV